MRSSLLKSSLILTVGKFGSYALLLARNIILARLLTKGDFGLVAAFSMTITLFELAGKMSIGMLLVQSKDGDSETLQNTIHSTHVALGFLSALLIACASRPIAYAFDAPHLAWAFATLAIIPIGQSFRHSDNSRMQRSSNFLPTVLTEFLMQFAMTLAIWPLSYLIYDFTIIIYLLTIKMVTGIFASHYMSSRPYRLSWDKIQLTKILRFSWPLLINGFVMIGAQQADQFMVGSLINLSNLGTYSVAIMLTMVPYFFAAHILGSLLMPTLSLSQDNQERFQIQYKKALGLTAVIAFSAMAPLMLIGEHLVTLLYGESFVTAGNVLSILAVASMIRFLKIVPATASISKADTTNQMYSNIFRLTSIPLAFILYSKFHTIESIAYATVIGEMTSFCISITRLRFKHNIKLMLTAKPICFVIGASASTLLLRESSLIDYNIFLDVIVTGIAIGLVTLVSLKIFPFNSDLLHSAFNSIVAKVRQSH